MTCSQDTKIYLNNKQRKPLTDSVHSRLLEESVRVSGKITLHLQSNYKGANELGINHRHLFDCFQCFLYFLLRHFEILQFSCEEIFVCLHIKVSVTAQIKKNH